MSPKAELPPASGRVNQPQLDVRQELPDGVHNSAGPVGFALRTLTLVERRSPNLRNRNGLVVISRHPTSNWVRYCQKGDAVAFA